MHSPNPLADIVSLKQPKTDINQGEKLVFFLLVLLLHMAVAWFFWASAESKIFFAVKRFSASFNLVGSSGPPVSPLPSKEPPKASPAKAPAIPSNQVGTKPDISPPRSETVKDEPLIPPPPPLVPVPEAKTDFQLEQLTAAKLKEQEQQREQALRDAQMKEAQRLEAERKEAQRREIERRLAEAKEAERKENERIEAERRNAAVLEIQKREEALLENQRKNAIKQENERKEAERRDAERRDAERRDAERRDAERRDAERRDAERRDAERRDAERRDAERRDAERRDAERRDAERRDAERRDAERRDAERRDADRRDAERQEAERKEAERKELEKREAERRLSERKEEAPPPRVKPAPPVSEDAAKEGEPDYKAAHLKNPEPKYPALAMRQRMQGRAVLLVEVSTEGKPQQITLFRSSGHDILDNAAIETVKGWRFVPAMKDGAPIVATIRVPINYQLGIFAR